MAQSLREAPSRSPKPIEAEKRLARKQHEKKTGGKVRSARGHVAVRALVDGALHDLHVPSRDVLPAQVEEEGGGGVAAAVAVEAADDTPPLCDPCYELLKKLNDAAMDRDEQWRLKPAYGRRMHGSEWLKD